MNSLGQAVLTFFLQSALVLGLACLGARFVRPAHVRLALLRYSFLAVAAVLILRVLAPGVSNPWLSAAPKSVEQFAPVAPTLPFSAAKPAPVVPAVAPVRHAVIPSPLPAPVREATSPVIDWGSLLIAAWILGSLALLARVGAGFLWLRRLRAGAKPLTYSRVGTILERLAAEGDVRDIEVASSPLVFGSPFVAGLKKPTIYFPEDLEFSDEEVEAIVAHELAHVRGRDPHWALASQVLVAILWPNPFAWAARRQLNLAAEERSDLMVLRTGTPPASYADCLLRIAERGAPQGRFALPGVRMFSSRKHLAKRISMLLSESPLSPTSLRARGHAQLAVGAGAMAIASCVLVPSPTKTVAPKQAKTELSFPVSAKDLSLIRQSGLPYLDGDFTLVYRVVSEDPRSDAERQADYDRSRVRYKADLDAAVAKGTVPESEAKAAFARFVLDPRPHRQERTVTLSSRNGLVLYKETGGNTVLLTRECEYTTYASGQGYVGTDLNILNWPYIPLPAAGFPHFPISQSKVSAEGSAVNVPDVPCFSAINGVHDKWEGGIVSDLIRSPRVLRFTGEGADRHIASIDAGEAHEYEYRKFQTLRGVPVATEFTRIWGGMHHDYTLQLADSHALPATEFDPAQVVKGKRLVFEYQGRRLDFTGDPNGEDFQAQLKRQLVVADAYEAELRKMRARSAQLEAIPGQAPDIMPYYQEALKKAKASNKIVLAISTASICAPCHQLERMLIDPVIKSIADKHYEVLWIDCGEDEKGKKFEHKNGEKLCKQLGIWTGFPSYAAVGSDGRVLCVVGTNGYPSTKDEDERFFKVLNAGGKILSEEERATIQGYLDAHR